ncbi:MAG TPA: cysteine synthase family protein [Pyrinomonadaceae bacterium]|nr:cysteine synthase family protein [Pyrinomonadaceae bacterium]
MPPRNNNHGQPPAIVNSILRAIGNTPVVKLENVVAPKSADVLVKLEYYNPTGSYKDRMALAMIEGAEARGDLKPGMEVVEYTGGSTGSSLALVCAVKGYHFRPISSDGFAREKLDTMRAFGADLTVMESDGGKLTPDLFQRMRAEAEARAKDENVFYTSQFHNEDAIKGYMNIGRELAAQAGGQIDVYCGAVGTAGMLMGVSRAFKEAGCAARIVALEPASSPVLTQGHGGAHRVEGISAGFVPPHLDSKLFDEARAINEAEARVMARRLAKEEGIFTGTSSGLNVAAAVKLASELGPGKTVATVAVDTGLKYLAGDLFSG